MDFFAVKVEKVTGSVVIVDMLQQGRALSVLYQVRRTLSALLQVRRTYIRSFAMSELHCNCRYFIEYLGTSLSTFGSLSDQKYIL